LREAREQVAAAAERTVADRADLTICSDSLATVAVKAERAADGQQDPARAADEMSEVAACPAGAADVRGGDRLSRSPATETLQRPQSGRRRDQRRDPGP
jgi:hypothetical protein